MDRGRGPQLVGLRDWYFSDNGALLDRLPMASPA